MKYRIRNKKDNKLLDENYVINQEGTIWKVNDVIDTIDSSEGNNKFHIERCSNIKSTNGQYIYDGDTVLIEDYEETSKYKVIYNESLNDFKMVPILNDMLWPSLARSMNIFDWEYYLKVEIIKE